MLELAWKSCSWGFFAQTSLPKSSIPLGYGYLPLVHILPIIANILDVHHDLHRLEVGVRILRGQEFVEHA